MALSSTPTTPQTLLEAVNDLLAAVRVSSVMSLNAVDINEAAAGAKHALDDAAREVSLMGWEFNTEYSYTCLPDPTNGNVNLPNNCLSMRSSVDQTTRYTKRGLRVYDNSNHTYAIGKAVVVDLTVALPFEEMPEGIKRYVTGIAARRWCIPQLPTTASFQYSEEMVRSALQLAREEDDRMRGTTLGDTSPHFVQWRRNRVRGVW